MPETLSLIHLAFSVAQWLVIARALMSFFPGLRRHAVGIWLARVVDPALRPLQRLAPPSKTGGLDVSPVLAIIILMILREIVDSFVMGSAAPPLLR